jgi:hypothetical protein
LKKEKKFLKSSSSSFQGICEICVLSSLFEIFNSFIAETRQFLFREGAVTQKYTLLLVVDGGVAVAADDTVNVVTAAGGVPVAVAVPAPAAFAVIVTVAVPAPVPTPAPAPAPAQIIEKVLLKNER